MQRTVVLAVLLASACAGASDPSSSGAVRVPVTVTIVYSGGPAPGTSQDPKPGTVHVSGEGTQVTREVRDGEVASFELAPGHYTASADSGDAQCFSTVMEVQQDSVSTWRVTCSVK
jgi:hypothetical protein